MNDDEGILIDDPGPFAPLEDWEEFAREMERVSQYSRVAAKFLEQARVMIAKRKANPDPFAP